MTAQEAARAYALEAQRSMVRRRRRLDRLDIYEAFMAGYAQAMADHRAEQQVALSGTEHDRRERDRDIGEGC